MKSIKNIIIECLPLFLIGLLSLILPTKSVVFIIQIIIGIFLIILGLNYLIFSNVSMNKKNILYYITILLLITGTLILLNGLRILGLISLLLLLVLTLVNIFIFKDKSISLINILIVCIIIFIYSFLQNYLDVLKIIIGCLSILGAIVKLIMLFINNKPKRTEKIIECEYDINE